MPRGYSHWERTKTMRRFFVRMHNVLAWLVLAGANLVIFLIALNVFGVASTEVHAWGGRVLMLLALLLAIAALVSRTSRLTVGLSILVFLLLMPVQGILYRNGLPGLPPKTRGPLMQG